MTDRERWQLRGPVRSCRLERKWYSRRCGADTCETEESGDVTTVEFRPDGGLSRQWHHNPDGSEFTSTYEYDDSRRLIQMRTGPAGGVVNLCLYKYDADARLVRVLAGNEGGDRTLETYEYGPSGCKRKTLYVDLAIQRSGRHHSWSVEGTDSGYSAPGAATLTTIYNYRDQPEQLIFRDLAGRELSRVEFQYDDAGHLLEEAQRSSKQVLPPEMLASLNAAQLRTVSGFLGAGGDCIRRTHTYDEQGRRIETRWNMGPLGFDRKTVTYNEHNDPIIEVYEHEEREYAIDEEGRLADTPAHTNASRSEAHFRYDYDSQGNWVSKIIEDEFSISTEERRTITYFI